MSPIEAAAAMNSKATVTWAHGSGTILRFFGYNAVVLTPNGRRFFVPIDSLRQEIPSGQASPDPTT